MVESKYIPVAFSDHFGLLVRVSLPEYISRILSPKNRPSFRLKAEVIRDNIFKARLEEARLCATQEVWAGAVRRSQQFEDEYWLTDNIHESVDPIIINIASDDEEEDDLYLDSDIE